MKNSIVIIWTFIILTSCHNSTFKSVKSISDTNKVSTADTIKTNVQNDTITKKVAIISYPPKKGRYYFFWDGFSPAPIDYNNFCYFIDDTSCFINKIKRHYIYNDKTGIIKISQPFDPGYDNSGRFDLYKSFSGAYTKYVLVKSGINITDFQKLFNVDGYGDESSFSLLGVQQYSDDRLSNYYYKPIDNDPIMNNSLNKIISSNAKNPFEDNLEYSKMILENKMDILKSKGSDQVNQSLSNKVDYTYESLISKWNKLENKEQKVERFYHNIKPHYTNEEILKSEILVVLNDHYYVAKIQDDLNNFGKIIDGEVLPIIK